MRGQAWHHRPVVHAVAAMRAAELLCPATNGGSLTDSRMRLRAKILRLGAMTLYTCRRGGYKQVGLTLCT